MALKASRTEIFDELWLIVASVIKYLIIVNMYLGNTVCIHCKPIPCNDYRDFPV